jgi:hypothetical protein
VGQTSLYRDARLAYIREEKKMSDLMNERVPAVCPECGRSFNVRLRDVKYERTVHCPLGHSVKLVDEGDGVRHLDRELDRFERDMKRVERDMNREIRRLSRRLR